MDDEAPEDGLGRLPGRWRAVVVAAAAVLAAVVATHTGMVFLHVAPSNALSREFAAEIDGYIRPEFQQNWKLFAPDPVHVQRQVHARVAVQRPDGRLVVGDWIDLSAFDDQHIRGNLAPSHTRNEFTKGWRAFLATHDPRNRTLNANGPIVASYLKRVALLRMSGLVDGASVRRMQLRVRTTPVPEPAWSTRRNYQQPAYRVLPWWPVTAQDFPEGSVR
ncbi:MAG: DUF5819 family protein [Haloechinothrix sp.]